MLDIGGQELLLITIVLLVVVGPKELPKVIVTMREMIRKLRAVASDFHKTLDDLVEESDIKSDITEVKQSFDSYAMLDDELHTMLEEDANAIQKDMSAKAVKPKKKKTTPTPRNSAKAAKTSSKKKSATSKSSV